MPEAPPPIAVVVSTYNGTVTSRLLEGARRAYAGRGGRPDEIGVIPAPGAFELAALAAEAARTGLFRGVLVLGCVIKGDTDHDVYINHAVAEQAAKIGAEIGVPIAFGLLTVLNDQQALDRAGGAHGNKGAEGMAALLDTVSAIDALRLAAVDGDLTVLPPVRFGRTPDKLAEGN